MISGITLNLAQPQLDAGGREAAIDHVRAAQDRDPSDPAIYALLGQAQDALGRHREAQQSYMIGLDHAPDNQQLFDLLDRSLMASERARTRPAAFRATPRQADPAELSASNRINQDYVSGPAPHSLEVGDSREHATVSRSDLTTGELLDVINPLHHLPLVSAAYRWASGDEIDGFARIAGGALYGGPFGMFSSALEHIFEASSGKDFGETIAAMLVDPKEGPDAVVAEIPTEK